MAGAQLHAVPDPAGVQAITPPGAGESAMEARGIEPLTS